jgi:L-ascorbate metabolism protein UlaG (beta-lactamase superfamily)
MYCIFLVIVIIILLMYHFKQEEMKCIIESLEIFLATKFNPHSNEYYTNSKQLNQWVAQQKHKQSKNPYITWLGHSSFLIQINGINVLTDPIFNDLSILYRRKSPVGILTLPKIHVIIISHNHRDHFDEASLSFIQHAYNPIILVPQGMSNLCHQIGFTRVTELDWWQQHHIVLQGHPDAVFTLLPAKHWSNRGLFDINQVLCGSWMIQIQGYHIYFAGDSAYDNHFKMIAQQFHSIHVALLPIGPNEPDYLMRRSHMSTEQACQAFLDLNAHIYIPMHWGTFELGTDTFDSPIRRLKTWWKSHQPDVISRSRKEVTSKQLVILKFGGHLRLRQSK